MQVLKLLLCFCAASISICAVAAIISRGAAQVDCFYFGKRLDSNLVVFVPCVFLAVLHLLIMGFGSNLLCYHMWLRRNNLTTLEHVLKYKGSRKLGQIKPLTSNQSEQTLRGPERVISREPLKLRSSMSSVRSKDDKSGLPSEKLLLQKQKSGCSSDAFLLGRPKTKFEKAEEYFKKSDKKTPSKLVSESSNSLSVKESEDRLPIGDNVEVNSNSLGSRQTNVVPRMLAKPVALKDAINMDAQTANDKITVVKKVAKRKLPPINMESTENSKGSPTKG